MSFPRAKRVLSHFFHRQFLLFLAVGGTSAGVNFSSRLLLNLWIPFAWAVPLAFGFGILTAFLLNSFLVFSRSQKAFHRQARDFLFVNAISFVVVWLLSLLFRSILLHWGVERYASELAHFLALGSPALVTFLAYKFFAFREI